MSNLYRRPNVRTQRSGTPDPDRAPLYAVRPSTPVHIPRPRTVQRTPHPPPDDSPMWLKVAVVIVCIAMVAVAMFMPLGGWR
jgi:hypothetical protein